MQLAVGSWQLAAGTWNLEFARWYLELRAQTFEFELRTEERRKKEPSPLPSPSLSQFVNIYKQKTNKPQNPKHTNTNKNKIKETNKKKHLCLVWLDWNIGRPSAAWCAHFISYHFVLFFFEFFAWCCDPSWLRAYLWCQVPSASPLLSTSLWEGPGPVDRGGPTQRR